MAITNDEARSKFIEVFEDGDILGFCGEGIEDTAFQDEMFIAVQKYSEWYANRNISKWDEERYKEALNYCECNCCAGASIELYTVEEALKIAVGIK